MPKRLRVGLLIDSHRTYERNLLRGIATYAHAHGPWSFYNLGAIAGDRVVSRLRQWDGDGLIVRSENVPLIRQIMRLKRPMVDLLGWYRHKGIPIIDTDHEAVAKLAANQLIERGFQHFAYCGFDSLYYSHKRSQHFVEYLTSLGYSVDIYEPRRSSGATYSLMLEAQGTLDAGKMATWIRALPRPIGLMACNDARGQQVIDICGECGVLVPEEMSVIAVGNDDVICEMCDPTLSSVEPNTRKAGYEAAALLHRMVLGETTESEITLIEPLGVMLRQSTDALSIADHQITKAMNYIRRHVSDGIDVADVLRNVRLSRRTLERRFLQLVGRSPKEEIIRMQVERIKQLLVRTDYHLSQVAKLAGFNYVEYMCKVFKTQTGMTPGQYREEMLAQKGATEWAQPV
ncbi:MAG: DNA-binding transcriptional regulator [Pirellulales bacterium]|nr:DNA-binding transcriptional regulator [Pirellulales bacterium]